MENKRYSIEFAADLDKQLTKLAKEKNMSKAELILQSLSFVCFRRGGRQG